MKCGRVAGMGEMRRTSEDGVSDTERELMRAGLRWTKILLAGALLLAAAPVLAQAVPDTTSNTPATDAVGPRELQNFSLPGTTTRPADQPATTAPAARNPPSGDGSRAEQSAPAAVSTRTVAARQPAHQPAPAPSQPASAMQPPEASVASPTPSLPATAAPLPQPSFAAPAPVPAPETTTATLTPGHRIPLLPWLIAALVLAAGAIFILWRRTHQRQAFAGAPEYDLFVAPEPTPAAPPRAPAPAPTPALRAAAPVPQPVPQPAPPAPAARPSGIVASRLRPSIELEMQPLRCTFDDEQVTIEFEVELFNSGTAPARAVIAEASLFNASAVQEQELAAFYARPPGTGDRIEFDSTHAPDELHQPGGRAARSDPGI